jgi:hypothetical protein
MVVADDGVTGLVIGDDLALLPAHHALLLEAGDQPIDRLVEVAHLDGHFVLARSEAARLR